MHVSCAISQEQYSIWSWFLLHLCKMLISTSVFLIFFEIFIFGADSTKNGPKLQKILSHSVSQELYLILFWFLVHICKMMIFPSIFVSCFQISDFSGFSELINKCQKEILRCAPTSSHVCDFFFVIKLMVHFRLYLKVN